MIVGIDLGTTNSLVGYMTPDGPKLIPNAFGEPLTPSVVGVDLDNNWLVGKSARELQTVHPERCAAVFKRHMGSDWKITIGGKTLTAVELSSMVLKALKDDAESALGVPIQEAVITVPAYFNEPQRQATIQAGRLAGLEVRRVVNEPTAAAIAYGLHEKSNEGILLVYDLGGGTFDVSIVEVFEGVLEVRSSAGEIFLGGEDFTTSLAAKILEGRGLMFERAEHEQPRMVARLKRECEFAKRALATAPSATVRIPDRDGSLREGGETATVTADEFRTWTANLLGRTTPPLRRALRDAKLTTHNIDEVILVGGATRMATVREHITSLFGKPPQSRLNPDEVVALGAAIQSALLKGDAAVGDMVVTDVCPFTLGVETSREIGGVRKGGYFSPIINRNTTIPASRTDTYSTLVPGQTEINFAIYQGESRYVADNLRLGELRVTGIPLSPKTESVEVRFTYDINGVLEVEATVQATGKKSSHVISRYASHLSPAQLDAAIKKLQTLKTHPREQAENQHLLQLAGRVWQELSVFERERLDGAIEVFEAALEDQSPTKIAEAREFLLAYLAPFLDEQELGDDGDE